MHIDYSNLFPSSPEMSSILSKIDTVDLNLPTEYLDEVETINEENKKRVAESSIFEMFTECKKDVLCPHHYFHSLEKKQLRSKKYKASIQAAKNDGIYNELHQKIKGLTVEFNEISVKNLQDNIRKTICFHAINGTGLEDLFLVFGYMSPMGERVKAIYIELCEHVRNKIPEEFFIDFKNMSCEEAEGFFRKKKVEIVKKRSIKIFGKNTSLYSTICLQFIGLKLLSSIKKRRH